MLYEPIPSEALFWPMLEALWRQFERKVGIPTLTYSQPTPNFPGIEQKPLLMLPAPTPDELNGGTQRG